MPLYHVVVRQADGSRQEHVIKATTADDAVTQARLRFARRVGDRVEVVGVRPYTIPPKG